MDAPMVQVLCQIDTQDTLFKTIIWKTDIQLLNSKNIVSKMKIDKSQKLQP